MKESAIDLFKAWISGDHLREPANRPQDSRIASEGALFENE